MIVPTFDKSSTLALISSDQELKKIFFDSHNSDSNSSILEVCNNFPYLKRKLNSEIRKSLIENDVYPYLGNSELRKNMTDSNFDFITFFDELIYRDRNDEKLVFYSPEELGNKSDNSKIILH